MKTILRILIVVEGALAGRSWETIPKTTREGRLSSIDAHSYVDQALGGSIPPRSIINLQNSTIIIHFSQPLYL